MPVMIKPYFGIHDRRYVDKPVPYSEEAFCCEAVCNKITEHMGKNRENSCFCFDNQVVLNQH